jgi:hypothetical protein
MEIPQPGTQKMSYSYFSTAVCQGEGLVGAGFSVRLWNMKLEIQRALRLFDGFARNTVRVDHRSSHIRMPEQRLDRADVVAGLEQMGRE